MECFVPKSGSAGKKDQDTIHDTVKHPAKYLRPAEQFILHTILVVLWILKWNRQKRKLRKGGDNIWENEVHNSKHFRP
jgi:hypothetical protein